MNSSQILAASTPPSLSLTHLMRLPARAEGADHSDTSSARAKPPLLLMLHGVGSNEHDLMELAPHLDSRFLIVSARSPRTLSPGAYGWYPVVFTPQGATGDTRDVESGRQTLLGFISEIVNAYDADPARVYLMGFSQGAIMSLLVALTAPDKIAGAVLMSGRLLTEALRGKAEPERLRGLPLLMVHGTRDSVLPVEGARAARRELEALPVDLTYQEFPMAHEVSADSLRVVSHWLSGRLDTNTPQLSGEAL